MPAVQWCGQSYRVAAAAQTDLFSHTFDGPIAWNKVQTIGTNTDENGEPDSDSAAVSTDFTGIASSIFSGHSPSPGSPAVSVTKQGFINDAKNFTVLWGDPHGSAMQIEAPNVTPPAEGRDWIPFLDGVPDDPENPDCAQDGVEQKTDEPDCYFLGLYSCSVLSSTGSHPIATAYSISGSNDDARVIVGFQEDLALGAAQHIGDNRFAWIMIPGFDSVEDFFDNTTNAEKQVLMENHRITFADHARFLRTLYRAGAERTEDAVTAINDDFRLYETDAPPTVQVTPIYENGNVIFLVKDGERASLLAHGDKDTRLYYVTVSEDELALLDNNGQGVTRFTTWVRYDANGNLLNAAGEQLEPPEE
jgi:hypothetical protein